LTRAIKKHKKPIQPLNLFFHRSQYQADLSDENYHTQHSASPPPPFAGALINQNTQLGTWDVLPRVLIQVLCDHFHKKGEFVIGTSGRIILTVETFFVRFYCAGQSEKVQLGRGEEKRLKKEKNREKNWQNNEKKRTPTKKKWNRGVAIYYSWKELKLISSPWEDRLLVLIWLKLPKSVNEKTHALAFLKKRRTLWQCCTRVIESRTRMIEGYREVSKVIESSVQHRVASGATGLIL
jgi:hypothetical protein